MMECGAEVLQIVVEADLGMNGWLGGEMRMESILRREIVR